MQAKRLAPHAGDDIVHAIRNNGDRVTRGLLVRVQPAEQETKNAERHFLFMSSLSVVLTHLCINGRTAAACVGCCCYFAIRKKSAIAAAIGLNWKLFYKLLLTNCTSNN